MFTLEVSKRALRDYDGIVAYLVKRSPQGAAAWADVFQQAMQSLPTSVDQHPRAPEDAHHAETIRNVLFKTRSGDTYRAIYILRGDRVFVTPIRGPGQRPVRRDRFFPK